jgi:DNA sulfur modification protein DndB
MDAPFEYVFPAIRGIQARHEYYVSMCPLRLIPKIFLFNEDELVPELRAQRVLNKGRIPDIARYVVLNRDSYVFSAITASIDGPIRFSPLTTQGDASRMGALHVSMSARFVINDGQHRRAAIEAAIREEPELADESIAVVFFIDTGLARCQQMFADLNRHAVRPSTSIGVLYDHRDTGSQLIKNAVLQVPLFRDLTELERSTLSARSRKLFTLSALYSATEALVARLDHVPPEQLPELVRTFWEELAKVFPDWVAVHHKKIAAGDVRADLLHTHGVILQAIGRAAGSLLKEDPAGWKKTLKRLGKIDWSRSNAQVWEGRAMVGGRVSKSTNHVILTTAFIKQTLGLELSPEEQRVEDAFKRGT